MCGHCTIALNDFLETLNQYHPTIKFTVSWSLTEVSFLDTKVFVGDGKVLTDLHIKPTDTHQYLERKSCHPEHQKIPIPYGQSLWFQTI